ncbi:hypothetical protein H4R99_006521 [Coemansia sp. RSA 1722]|nr:hypothetical protein H4R99_006521 [Coemansia sp. RSA 1722]
MSLIGNVVRLRDASVMMPEMTTLAFCNNLLWSLYGHLKDDPYMMIPNGIGTTLCAIQLFLIVYYGRKSASALPVAVVGGGGGGAAAAGMSSDAVPMAEIP